MKYFKPSLSWLLVGLYATIYCGWDVLHAHAHQEIVVSHSLQQEKDPCHRSVFHGEKDTHKNHLTEFKNCASCHVVSQPPTFHEGIITLPVYTVVSEKTADQAGFRAKQAVSLFSSRAPPFSV